MNNNINLSETAYDIIAKVLKLEHLHDTIYKDKEGHTFILNKYGFQPAAISSFVQMKNEHEMEKKELISEIETLKKKITKLETKLRDEVINGPALFDLLGRRSKSKILTIIKAIHKDDTDKVKEIYNYITKDVTTKNN